jgi:hypothetical protein
MKHSILLFGIFKQIGVIDQDYTVPASQYVPFSQFAVSQTTAKRAVIGQR